MISGEDLAAYAAGEADPALVARVESALPGDPSLARRLDAIREVDAHLARWEPPALGVDGAARLRAAVDADLAGLLDSTGDAAAGSRTAASSAAAATSPVADDVRDSADARSGGVRAAGARPASNGAVDRLRAWWRDHVGEPGDLPGWAGGVAVAAVVLVIGVAVVSNGIGGGQDDAADTTMMADAPAEADADAGGAEGFASSGTEAVTGSELMESEAMSEAASEEAMEAESAAGEAADAGRVDLAGVPPIIDDGRVVAALGDVDPEVLRDRLEPLVGLLDPDAVPRPVPDDEDKTAATEAAGSDGASPTPLADARVTGIDVRAVAACRPSAAEAPIVAEVIMLAPAQDVILYVFAERVVVVAASDCSTLAVRLG